MIYAIVFCLIAGAGPALWLAHNRWYFGDPLYFYRGPWSALAIQGSGTIPAGATGAQPRIITSPRAG